MTCSRSDCSPLLFFICFSTPHALFCVTDHTTKLGMKVLVKDQQWGVERDSNLIPPQDRTNALTTIPCSHVAYSPIGKKLKHGNIKTIPPQKNSPFTLFSDLPHKNQNHSLYLTSPDVLIARYYKKNQIQKGGQVKMYWGKTPKLA